RRTGIHPRIKSEAGFGGTCARPARRLFDQEGINMGQPFVGEIRMFGGNFAPVGWMTCDGQLIPISENETLFNLIGTTYGGDGQSTFALPNLAARVPVHMGTGPGSTSFLIGQNGGVTSVTLTTAQLPSHSHALLATSSGQQQSPASNT